MIPTRVRIVILAICTILLANRLEARRHYKHSLDSQGTEIEESSKKKEIHHLDEESTKEIPWQKYAKMMYSKNSVDEDEGSYCHKVALKRCGNSFMKVFELFTFLPRDQAFQAKCASRTAFYSCLKKFSTKPCMSSWHFHIEEKFRKRLAENLWSARTCVLGIKPTSHTLEYSKKKRA